MAMLKVKQFTSWSYSRYRDHDRCPLYAKLKHLDKISEGPESPAMARGSAIGKMAENYVLGKLKALPAELKLFAEEFKAVRALKMKNVFVEESWLYDNQFRPIEHQFPQTKTGDIDWNNMSPTDWTIWRSIWLRVKQDLCGIDKATNVLVPVDHKTGKYRENDLGSYLEQLEIYALGGMLKFPEVVGASPRLWFLDEGVIYPQINGDEIYYDRSELDQLKRKWVAKLKPMFEDKTFRPKPNNKCQYCTYSASKGGTCRF